MRPVDHAGKRFGQLQLLRKLASPHRYVCRCDCGLEITVLYSNLSTGNTISCGCFRREACRLRERAKNHPTHGKVWSYYRRNAKIRGFAWNLTQEQFDRLISGDCRYCGQAPGEHALGGKRLVFNGIDRVDNDRGYEVDNCVSCCATCNRAKLMMTINEFKTWVARVYEVLNGNLLHK